MPLSFQSEIGTIQRMLVKPPAAAFRSQVKLDHSWQALNYLSAPIFEQAKKEFSDLLRIFENWNIQIEFLSGDPSLSPDSIYCRDASILSDAGAIICRMGKDRRRGEPAALEAYYKSQGIPILGKITDTGTLEGGDTAWIDPNTLAVGHGYRSNAEGIRQLRAMARGHFEVLEVPLPHFRGPSDVFHLMSILSPIDQDLMLVYSPYMVVPFRNWLLERGITLIEVPPEEFDSMGGNVLAVAPRKCLMLEGNPVTQARLQAAGIEVKTYIGQEISAKGCGGPTCLTRPLDRMI